VRAIVADGRVAQIFRELLTYMLGDPHTVEPAHDLILISRHLERIGNHATNVAEDVICGSPTKGSIFWPGSQFGLGAMADPRDN